MKMLLVTKRHFMTKDIVREAYGRQYELATHLANRGWSVRACCLDYRSIWARETMCAGGVEWQSYAASLRGLGWLRGVTQSVDVWAPHIILGCSDPLHIAVAHIASKRAEGRLVVDLHDNLDSKGMTKVPGLRLRVVKALRDADLVTCVSEPLADMVKERFETQGNIVVLESAIPEIFQRMRQPEKEDCRAQFGFGADDCVIGVPGALYRERGIETVLAGFERLRKEHPRLVLALAGPTDRDRQGFEQEGVRYFGNLEWKAMPAFLSTLDVGIVPNIRPLFADYCYPQKAVELCALSIPIVAANLGVMKIMAKKAEQILYQPDDPADFARAVKCQLEDRIVLHGDVKSWEEQAEKLNRSLAEILKE